MFSLSVKEVQDRQRAEGHQQYRRTQLPPNREAQDRRMQKIYAKTRDQMAESYYDRVDTWISETLSSQPIMPVNEGMVTGRHTFRDRNSSLELGHTNGHVSASTYVPRAHYRGGGQLLRGKPVVVDGPPRPATVSCEAQLHQVGTTGSVYDDGFGGGMQRYDGQGRIRQPPYKNGKYFLRPREKSKEIGAHMKFRPCTETERINEEVARQGVGLAMYPFEEGAQFCLQSQSVRGGWRAHDPSNWKSGDQRLVSRPETGVGDLLKGVSGQPFGQSLASSEPYYESTRNIARPTTVGGEMGRDIWQGTVAHGRSLPSSSRISKWLNRSVNPTHTPSGIALPASATAQPQWPGKRSFGQSIRSLPSQILRQSN